MSVPPTGQHLAAILPSKGSALEIAYRITPTPGPKELLVEVKSVAVNPVDYFQRELGFMITEFPAVLGSDVGGIVISAGSEVDTDAFKPGTRVAAFATAFFVHGNPNYGAFQQFVLVPVERTTPLPENLSFNEAALLPMAVGTTWAAWYTIGLPRDTSYKLEDKQGMLIWGGASSIGSGGVQIAKMLGFHVYVTASEKNHEYMKQLGASKVFDYKDENVVQNIVKAAKEDGMTIRIGYDAVAQLQPCLEVLNELKGDGVARLATAQPLDDQSPKMDGVEAAFISPPEEESPRSEYMHFVFNVWLKEKLEKGEYVPSPRIKIVPGGLEAINKALDEWKKGVSGEKIVLEI